jgi:hypothetical protein
MDFDPGNLSNHEAVISPGRSAREFGNANSYIIPLLAVESFGGFPIGVNRGRREEAWHPQADASCRAV